MSNRRSRSPSASKEMQLPKPKVTKYPDNPQSSVFEFGGPIGATILVFFKPVIILFVYFATQRAECLNLNPFNVDSILDSIPRELEAYFNLEAFAIVFGWVFFLIILERKLPCDIVEGTTLRDGSKLKYRLNAHLTFWVSILILCTGYPVFGEHGFEKFTHFPLSRVYDLYLPIAVASLVLSISLAIFVFLRSFRREAMQSLGGNTESFIYNFFIGRELNPRIGDFDIKEFVELRPGMIGWFFINLACAFKQHETFGEVSWEMVLLLIFQGLYVWDSVYYERSILTTMDITTDGFGFMLSVGSLSWVPFTFSVQARYLASLNPANSLEPFILCVATAINIVGYMLFRGANLQKDRFRRDDPLTADVKYITTESGRKLMISGWWGLARKINYTGDLLMGLSWCMLTGFDCFLTYFYVIYFAPLLIHRANRDDLACQEKYGKDWDRYKKFVPYKFIPGLY